MNLNEYWNGIQQDDEGALERLFNQTYENLCQYAFYITENRFLSEEIVQDVYLKIWQGRHKLLIKGSFRSYLYKSVHNHSINAILSQKSKKSSVNRLLSGESWQVIVEWLEFDDYIIERIETSDTEKIVTEVIKKLPEQCRKIFELSRYEDKSNKEIAHHLKISENTVKTQIYRALNKIKESLF